MDRDSLGAFEPLRDAVPDIFPETGTEVFVKGCQEGTLKGRRYELEGICEVPLYLAIFLIARREATLELPPE